MAVDRLSERTKMVVSSNSLLTVANPAIFLTLLVLISAGAGLVSGDVGGGGSRVYRTAAEAGRRPGAVGPVSPAEPAGASAGASPPTPSPAASPVSSP